VVVSPEELLQPSLCFWDGAVGLDVNVIVFHGPPESLDHDIVEGTAPPIHGYFHTGSQECLNPQLPGELTALVTVQNVRLAIFENRTLEGGYAEVGVERIAQLPFQYEAAMPVHDRHQIGKASFEGNVGNINGPNVIGPVDFQVPEQIRIHLMRWILSRQVWLLVDRHHSHLAQQAPQPLRVEQDTLIPQVHAQHLHSPCGILQADPVDDFHQGQIHRILLMGFVVEARSGQAQQFALPPNRELLVCL